MDLPATAADLFNYLWDAYCSVVDDEQSYVVSYIVHTQFLQFVFLVYF
jgi:hypothetical protein